MNKYNDEFVTRCPYCGGTEMIRAFQGGYATITSSERKLSGMTLYHTVCLKCGSVVRSYVKEPGKLLKRKDRNTD